MLSLKERPGASQRAALSPLLPLAWAFCMSKPFIYLCCIWCQANKSFTVLSCLKAPGSIPVLNARTGGISGQFKHSSERPEPLQKFSLTPSFPFLPLVCLRNTFLWQTHPDKAAVRAWKRPLSGSSTPHCQWAETGMWSTYNWVVWACTVRLTRTHAAPYLGKAATLETRENVPKWS